MSTLLLLLLVFLAVLLVVGMKTQPALMSTSASGFSLALGGGQGPATTLSEGTAESIVGAPTISAAHINAILSASGSPAQGLGQDIYDAGTRYDIDPVHVLAIFLHESRMGTTGEARTTMSPGNERCIAGRRCVDQSAGGYAQMQSWHDGFEHLYALLSFGYVQGHVTIPIVGHACVTIEQIVEVFAPSRDHNDVQAYVAAWKAAVGRWRQGAVGVGAVFQHQPQEG